MGNPRRKTRELTLMALFTALIALGAFIKIPVPFMDYFTLQFLFVLLSGILLGGRLGGMAVVIYVLLGLVGFPIFAAGGGIAYVLRPSFGYLLGFILTGFVVGFLVEKKENPGFKEYLVICLLGMVITYGIGFIYKYFILNFYLEEATTLMVVILAALPLDIPGDILLCFIGAGLGRRLRQALRLGDVHERRNSEE